MTPEQFNTWRKDMGFTQAKAAAELGISKASVENYERGHRREDNRPVEIPRTVALACRALWHRMAPWGEE